MKKALKTFFGFLVILFLIAGIIAVVYYFYFKLFPEEDLNQTINLNRIVTEIPSSEEDKKKTETNDLNLIGVDTTNQNNEKTSKVQNINNSVNSFFYNQLNDNQKIIYNGLQENKSNLKSGEFVIKYGDKFSDLLAQEGGSDILGNDYQTGIEAFTHDNPELFYLDVNKLFLNIETTTKFLKTTYNVYIGPKKGTTYYNSDVSNLDEVNKIEAQIQNIKNNVIKSLKGNDYQNILYIHDYLIDSIEYDKTYSAKRKL